MSKILIFGGTTEGRVLASACDDLHISAILSVATEYGKDILPKYSYVQVRSKRLNVEEISQLMEDENISCVIDASHPYAFEISRNILSALKNINDKKDILFFRIIRENNQLLNEYENALQFASNAEAADYLLNTEGNILLTIGSKEVSAYQDIANRVFPRVLPSVDSINLCIDAKVPLKNIIAMQGPFSEELNKAIIKNFNCKYLVTKLSGKTGGFDEKAAAAMEADCTLIIILPRDETFGISLNKCIDKIRNIYGN